MNFKKGFTLAEVLITLGIIGVVASLTLPPLIQKHQKQVWVNQLKKSVSTWENGFKMMMADAETDDLLNTEFWQKLQELAGGDSNFDYSCEGRLIEGMYDSNDKILKKYFKILSFGDLKGGEGTCSMELNEDSMADDKPYAYKPLGSKEYPGLAFEAPRKIQMADGTTVGLYAHPVPVSLSGFRYENEYRIGQLIIDVNGKNKGPNQWGRDTFAFWISRKGVLLPYATKEYLMVDPSLCGNIETGDISDAMGLGCERRIIDDGWKMNY